MALAQLAAAAVAGLLPAGPEVRQRQPIALSPKRSPARDPPYFKTQVLRRKLGELN